MEEEGFEPNEKFYRSIDREFQQKQEHNRVESQFKYLCLRDHLVVFLHTTHYRGKMQTRARLTDYAGFPRYDLLGPVCSTKEDAVYLAKRRVVDTLNCDVAPKEGEPTVFDSDLFKVDYDNIKKLYA